MTTPLRKSPCCTRRVVCPLVFGVSVLILVLSANASADFTVCTSGTGGGQCEKPQGVAVNREDGLVYVADSGNNRIDVFNTAGVFQTSFGQGQLSAPYGVAVDDSGGPSQGDIYVVDKSLFVRKFKSSGEFISPPFGGEGKGKCQLFATIGSSIAVGPGGVVYVADSAYVGASEANGFKNRVQKFAETGACLEEVVLSEGPRPLAGFAVDSVGDIYATDDSGLHGIDKYDGSGSLLYELTEVPYVNKLGVDGADNLFAAENDGSHGAIAEYGTSGKTLRRFGYDAVQHNLLGIVPFHSASPPGDVFASEGGVGVDVGDERVKNFALPSPGPIAVRSTLKANPIGNAKATLSAQVNPEGKVTSYHFEYLTQQAFEEQGNSFTGPATKATAVKPIAMAAGNEFILHAVSEQVGCPNPVSEAPEGKCLIPGTAYRFRVVASNADNPSGAGDGTVETTFQTKPPLEFETYATEVGVDTATFHAKLNPLGIPATGYFEYVDDASFQASGFAEAAKAPSAGQLSFGSGEAPVTRSATVSLAPNTTYHYRLIAEDFFVTLPGEADTLSTFAPLPPSGPCANEAFRAGAGAFLADCRAYEMVSPLDKNNGDVLPLDEIFTETPAELDQSSLSGNRLAYSSAVTFGDSASAPYTAQYIAARDPAAGWQSHSIVPPRGAPVLVPGREADAEFRAFSPDLCSGWLRTLAEPVLAPGANPGFANLYRRTDEECGGPGYEALTIAPPTHEGGPGFQAPNNYYFSLELQGVSADGGEAIYVVRDALTEDAPPPSAECLKNPESGDGCALQLYAYSAVDQSLHYVCILPSGQASKSCSAGWGIDSAGYHRENRVENAISADGSRVFWTAGVGTSTTGAGKIYLRENPSQPQSELVSGECTEPALACTIAVSKEAEALSGATASEYWSAAQDGSKAIFSAVNGPKGISDLYEFQVDTKTTQLIAHKVSGVMGASEDASYVYFTSTEDLDGGGPATGGEQNLYLYHEGSVRFVARLTHTDVIPPEINPFSPVAGEPRRHMARVSADGLHAAFMSFATPTGYDNLDANNGKVAAEVYLYDAGANGGSGKLVCPSCNPTGARPVGSNFAAKPGQEYWAAAQIPLPENSLYAARVLSEDGKRLYFTSSDVLSPRDTNGTQDLYQWEQPGTGGCDQQDPGFAPASGGCLTLVSSGKSDYPSEFVDASPSGDDVFFSTLSGLVSQDYGLVDIYDARVGGGFPPPAPPQPGCEGEACQPPFTPPDDATPASSSFEGEGNVNEGTPTHGRCAQGKVKKHRKCVAKNHHKRAKRNRRAGR